jgi:hypothetical protein
MWERNEFYQWQLGINEIEEEDQGPNILIKGIPTMT